MAKAGVRALDTLTAFAKTLEPSYNITSFMVAGGSKRGWTTYLVAAADTRVFAIIPEVLTCLNFVAVMRHQYRAYGGWSFSNKDYFNENITQDLEHPSIPLMTDIIDPYVYRDRLTMPKLLISGAGDEHFMPDDTWYFWNNLTGTKYYWMLGNSGHDIGDSPEGYKILPNEVAFYLAVKTNFQLPQISWVREQTSTGGSITVTTDTVPLEISAVYADTNDALRRDFRMHIGIPDPSSPVPSDIVWIETFNIESVDLGVYRVQFDNALDGKWRAFFIKMTFPGPDGLPFYVSTEVNIIQDTFLYEDCHGPEMCRGVLL
jgi:PhoPQ-activated pathogenicity-related protein